MSMLLRAAICGLNGAGSAFGPPNGLWAAVRPDHRAAVAKAVKAATSMTATTRPRMTLILLEAHLLGRDAACPLCQRDQLSPPSSLDALQRAFGLDRNFRVGARRRTSDDAELLVARLVARGFNVFWIHLLAQTRNLVGAEQVGARDDTAAVLHSHGHLGVGNGGAVRVPHEAEIGGSLLLLAVVVVVAEAGAARPRGDRKGTGHCKHRAHHPSDAPNPELHPVLLGWRCRASAVSRRNMLACKIGGEIVRQDGQRPNRDDIHPSGPQP